MEQKKLITINTGGIQLEGILVIPNGASSIVIFSHGSGSNRMSPRNNYVASVLNKEKIATFLVDLLTEEEDRIYENRFNIDLLENRIVEVTKQVQQFPGLEQFKTGFFGASTGSASALIAAVKLKNLVSAIVSRGGRPDLATTALNKVTVPVLLIVGSNDSDVVNLNKEAYQKLKGIKKIEIIKGATHLFEEPGKLEEVAVLSAKWFKNYLAKKNDEPSTKIIHSL